MRKRRNDIYVWSAIVLRVLRVDLREWIVGGRCGLDGVWRV